MKKLSLYVFLGLLWCNVSNALPECKGEDTMKWTNCIGTATFDNMITIYKGEWLNGYAHGEGILIGPGLEKYVGQFKNGLKDGMGKLKYENGEEYQGSFKDGLKHGRGRIKEKSGTPPKIYIGFWENDVLVRCNEKPKSFLEYCKSKIPGYKKIIPKAIKKKQE